MNNKLIWILVLVLLVSGVFGETPSYGTIAGVVTKPIITWQNYDNNVFTTADRQGLIKSNTQNAHVELQTQAKMEIDLEATHYYFGLLEKKDASQGSILDYISYNEQGLIIYLSEIEGAINKNRELAKFYFTYLIRDETTGYEDFKISSEFLKFTKQDEKKLVSNDPEGVLENYNFKLDLNDPRYKGARIQALMFGGFSINGISIGGKNIYDFDLTQDGKPIVNGVVLKGASSGIVQINGPNDVTVDGKKITGWNNINNIEFYSDTGTKINGGLINSEEKIKNINVMPENMFNIDGQRVQVPSGRTCNILAQGGYKVNEGVTVFGDIMPDGQRTGMTATKDNEFIIYQAYKKEFLFEGSFKDHLGNQYNNNPNLGMSVFYNNQGELKEIFADKGGEIITNEFHYLGDGFVGDFKDGLYNEISLLNQGKGSIIQFNNGLTMGTNEQHIDIYKNSLPDHTEPRRTSVYIKDSQVQLSELGNIDFYYANNNMQELLNNKNENIAISYLSGEEYINADYKSRDIGYEVEIVRPEGRTVLQRNGNSQSFDSEGVLKSETMGCGSVEKRTNVPKGVGGVVLDITGYIGFKELEGEIKPGSGFYNKAGAIIKKYAKGGAEIAAEGYDFGYNICNYGFNYKEEQMDSIRNIFKKRYEREMSFVEKTTINSMSKKELNEFLHALENNDPNLDNFFGKGLSPITYQQWNNVESYIGDLAEGEIDRYEPTLEVKAAPANPMIEIPRETTLYQQNMENYNTEYFSDTSTTTPRDWYLSVTEKNADEKVLSRFNGEYVAQKLYTTVENKNTFTTKNTVQLNEIFKPGNEPKYIIVGGNPGIRNNNGQYINPKTGKELSNNIDSNKPIEIYEKKSAFDWELEY